MRISFLISGIVLLVGFFYTQTMVVALTSVTDFKVRAFVGIDTTPPTTPVLETVVPVTETQINLAWSTSIDDVLLLGYRLFRDGTQIATTSQTSFSDGGLTPGTLYSYTVDAYDSFYNFSSSSVAMATTTFATPSATTTPTTTPRTTTGTRLMKLVSIEVVPAQRSALIRWQNTMNAQYAIRWGRTTSYELGSVSTSLFSLAHETTLDRLEPGTRYWYTILATNNSGVTVALQNGEFTTLAAFQSNLPPNVRNVQVSVQGADVSLIWQNPPLAPGSRVRVIRSHLFYPLSITDGALVYEGVGSDVRDVGALTFRSPQYYSIFVIDTSGAVSSGAVAFAESQSAENQTQVIPVTIATTTAPIESGEVAVLRADAVFIRQGSVTQVLQNPITLDTEQTYTIYIPRAAVAANLKSIIVSVQDPTDQRIVTTYLLKLNQNGVVRSGDTSVTGSRGGATDR